jgi:iron complex outermembrane receptor protein
MSKTLLRNEIRRGLSGFGVAGAIVALGFAMTPTGANAQDAAPAGDEAKLETIVVTGSRIRSSDIETAQPVVVIDRAQIEKSGFTSVGDILQNLTVASGAGISRSSVLVSNTYAGGSYVDIRGLGIQRALVLVNGRRWVKDVEAGLTDLSTIPKSMIERIEVLKDGASAIYGSDAISGVVNIITRDNYDGAEANVYYGQYDQDDGMTESYDFTLGRTGNDGSLVVSAAYTKQDPIFAKDRPYSAFPFGADHPTVGLSGAGDRGGFFPAVGGQLRLNPGGDPRNIDDYHPYSAALDAYDVNQQMMLQNSYTQKSIFLQGRYNILDNITFRTEMLYNKRDSTVQVGGYPTQTGNTGLTISADSYYNPIGSWTDAGRNYHAVDADGNVFDGPQEIGFIRRGVEVPRVTENSATVYHFTGGLEGYFDFASRTLNWDVNYGYSKNDGDIRGTGNIDLLKAAQALGPSFLDTDGVVRCGTSSNVIAGCVPWNVLAGPGGYTQAMLDYVYLYTHQTYGTTSKDITANLTGDLFELPAGALAFAVGYEHRNESGFVEPDYYSSTGNSTDLASAPTNGSYSLDEGYLELSIPVLKDLPLARQLEFDVAARTSHYSNFGSTTNGKFSAKWKPIDDLLVRGNYSKGFRAPAIGELFGGTSQTFDFYLDPCDSVFGAAGSNAAVAARCAAAGLPTNFRQRNSVGDPIDSGGGGQSNTPFLSGSNPDLQPETATTKTLGVVYSPSYLEGFNVSLDWYRVRIENVVSGFSSTQILNNCYVQNSPAFCAAFTRDANGQVSDLNRSTTNFGWIETEGYDLSATYRLPETPIGRFLVNWEANYVSKFETFADPETGIAYSVGRYGAAPVWRIRSNLSLDWSLGDFGATWGVRYFSSLGEPCSFDAECSNPDYVAPDVLATPFNRLGAVTFHDVAFRYHTPWKGDIQVGAKNVFDKVGPMFYTAAQGNSQFAYNPQYDYGRFFYAQYQQKF